MSVASDERKSTYIVDGSDAAEIARLINQDHLLTRNMKGPFPERSDFSQIHDVVDLACGPGGWVLEMARTSPKISVLGIDLSKEMVNYARAFARSQGLENAQFRVMNILQPFELPDESFDVVNARFIYPVMPVDGWPAFMQECKRILRPGGILRLTEPEWPMSSAPNCEKLVALFLQALHRAGRSFSPDGRHLSITPMLGHFLRQAGFSAINSYAHVLNYSVGTEEHETYFQNLMVAFRLLLPFMEEWKVITAEEFEMTYQRALAEMMADNFCGLCFYITSWGEKR